MAFLAWMTFSALLNPGEKTVYKSIIMIMIMIMIIIIIIIIIILLLLLLLELLELLLLSTEVYGQLPF